jgi:hypothetical protein
MGDGDDGSIFKKSKFDLENVDVRDVWSKSE